MMIRGATRSANIFVVMGSRLFSSATARAVSKEATVGILTGNKLGGSVQNSVFWIRAPMLGVRNLGTVAVGEKEQEVKEKEKVVSAAGDSENGKDEKRIVSYWGVETPKLSKEDGTEWKWHCFRVCMHVFLSALQQKNLYVLILYI